MAPPMIDLDAARGEGDREADAIVLRLGRDVWIVNRLLAQVTSDDQRLPRAVDPEIARLVVPELPPWADLHRLRRAQKFADKRLLFITVALFCAALPAGYCAVEGARVLRLAGRMTGDLDRRINETARFVLDVQRPNSFDPGGRARIALGKVRLIHAAVRASLIARGYEQVAINQEDQLGTLGLFSVVVVKSLVRLGVDVSARDREDFFHLWRVAGAMMGVREDLLPDSYDGAEELLYAIKERQNGPSEDGKALMAALLQGMEDHVKVPGLTRLPRALVRYLLGSEMASWIGIEADGSAKSFSLGGLHAFQRLAPQVGKHLLDAVTLVKLGGERATFEMPTSTT
jgi:hypothetical protein